MYCNVLIMLENIRVQCTNKMVFVLLFAGIHTGGMIPHYSKPCLERRPPNSLKDHPLMTDPFSTPMDYLYHVKGHGVNLQKTGWLAIKF